MVNSNDQYLSNSLEYVYKPEIGQRTKYTANTGSVKVTAANANLDGTGTLYTLLTPNLANGTLIKTITVKSETTTVKGMIRIFVTKFGGSTLLISEIEIPAREFDSIQETFALSLEIDYMLEYRDTLKVSTQFAQTFSVIAEGLDISFP